MHPDGPAEGRGLVVARVVGLLGVAEWAEIRAGTHARDSTVGETEAQGSLSKSKSKLGLNPRH